MPKSIMTPLVLSILRILLLLAAVYTLAAIGAHFLSGRLIFPRPPSSYQITPDLVQLTASDGTRLVCREWPNPVAKFTLLWFHGNGEDLGTIAEGMEQFQKAGFSIFAPEYRGYGQSGGTPTEANIYADAARALDWLIQHGTPRERIIIFGYSAGGGAAVDLASHERVAGLVLQCCFVSAYRVITRVPIFPGDKFENHKKLPRVQCPVLVIHGTADETIPFWHGKRLYAAATGRKYKLFVEGGQHVGLGDYAGEIYWRTLRDFAASL